MKESTKINLINLLKRHIHYVDGFWKLDKDLATEEKVRDYIKSQGVPILEKDVTDILSELSFNKCKFDIDGYVRGRVASMAEQATGKRKGRVVEQGITLTALCGAISSINQKLNVFYFHGSLSITRNGQVTTLQTLYSGPCPLMLGDSKFPLLGTIQ